jgi:hypothetical protein
VVKNADAGMRERLGEDLYAKVRAEEKQRVADALPQIQLDSLKTKLTEKRAQRVRDTIYEIALGRKDEELTAKQLGAKLSRRGAAHREAVLNCEVKNTPLLCHACTIINKDDTTGLPKVACVLIKMGADTEKAARWILDNDRAKADGFQRFLTGVAKSDDELAGKVSEAILLIDEELKAELLEDWEDRFKDIQKPYKAALALDPTRAKDLEAMYAQVEKPASTREGLAETLKNLAELSTQVRKVVFEGGSETVAKPSPEAVEALRGYWDEIHSGYVGTIDSALKWSPPEGHKITSLRDQALDEAGPEGNLLKAVRLLTESHRLAMEVDSRESAVASREKAVNGFSEAVEGMDIMKAMGYINDLPCGASTEPLQIITLWLAVMKAGASPDKEGLEAALNNLEQAVNSFETDDARVTESLATLLKKLRS